MAILNSVAFRFMATDLSLRVGPKLLDGGEQRVGKAEEHGDTHTDQERRVDQTSQQEHEFLQLRDQFGLTGSRFRNLEPMIPMPIQAPNAPKPMMRPIPKAM